MSGGGVEVRIGVKVRGERSNIIGGLEVCTPYSRPDKRQQKVHHTHHAMRMQ